MLIDTKMNWQDGKQECGKVGMNMVIITDEQEHQFIRETIE